MPPETPWPPVFFWNTDRLSLAIALNIFKACFRAFAVGKNALKASFIFHLVEEATH